MQTYTTETAIQQFTRRRTPSPRCLLQRDVCGPQGARGLLHDQGAARPHAGQIHGCCSVLFLVFFACPLDARHTFRNHAEQTSYDLRDFAIARSNLPLLSLQASPLAAAAPAVAALPVAAAAPVGSAAAAAAAAAAAVAVAGMPLAGMLGTDK